MNEEAAKEVKLIAVYGRVSTARQEEDGTIETQMRAVREHAQKHGYTIVKEYVDEGWSGSILARPQLDQLREDAGKKMWEAALIYDPDRLSRVYAHQALVRRELQDKNIEVLFVTTPPTKNDTDELLFGVKGIFAKYEKAKIAERFRLGKLRKVKEGHVLVSEAPFGYTYIPGQEKVHGYYEVNEEARIVKMIFGWVANNKMTIRGVVRKLQDLGIKPRKSKRGVWSPSTLGHILENTTYIGEAHYGKTYAVAPENPFNKEKYRRNKKTSRKIRPEEEWIAKIAVPAIIDKDLFARAQKQIKANYELSKRNRKNDYLLSGKIRCSCGKTRAGEGPQHGKHLYYRCTDRVNSFPLPATCHEGGINARVADKLVWAKVSELMASPELMEEQIKRWKKDQNSKVSYSAVDVDTMRKQVLKHKEEEDRYTKAYGAGAFPVEKLKEYTGPLRQKVAALESQIAQAEVEERRIKADALPAAEEIKAFAAKARMTLANLSFDAKQAIVRNVLDKAVGTQKELHVYGYIPVATSHYGLQTIDRHRRPPERGQVDPL